MTFIIFAVFLLFAAAGVLAQAKDSEFIKDPCDNYCLNGGKCKGSDFGPYCRCPKGFTGNRCQNVTGTCPTFDLTTTVCGIVTCKTDADCRPSQKCCGLNCNRPEGPFCVSAVFPTTTPPPTPQPDLPCNTVDCRDGFICRNIAECLNCPLTAKCFLPTDLAQGIDKTCQSYSYNQAILLKSPRNRNSYSQLSCKGPASMSTNTCPDGSFCVNTGKKSRPCCAVKIDQVPRK